MSYTSCLAWPLTNRKKSSGFWSVWHGLQMFRPLQLIYTSRKRCSTNYAHGMKIGEGGAIMLKPHALANIKMSSNRRESVLPRKSVYWTVWRHSVITHGSTDISNPGPNVNPESVFKWWTLTWESSSAHSCILRTLSGPLTETASSFHKTQKSWVDLQFCAANANKTGGNEHCSMLVAPLCCTGTEYNSSSCRIRQTHWHRSV